MLASHLYLGNLQHEQVKVPISTGITPRTSVRQVHARSFPTCFVEGDPIGKSVVVVVVDLEAIVLVFFVARLSR